MKNHFDSPFSGSYSTSDCYFLLKKIAPDYQTIENKELLIQSGRLHYSQLISKENPPTETYLKLFYHMVELYQERLANEIMILAKLIVESRMEPICLVSLARAGTPVGVLLKRAISDHLKKQCSHYSISIIRDRGIDQRALDYLLVKQNISPRSIVFIDGWTAKGVITHELKKSVAQYNAQNSCDIAPELYVISDIGGTADVAATFDDYTIPSALLNSTVSGLVSRSILNDQIGPANFHGCIYYDSLQDSDLSNWFIDQICLFMREKTTGSQPALTRSDLQQMAASFLHEIQTTYQISDKNRIKPGIAEATRVLLRRIPDTLLVKDLSSLDVAHLLQLCTEKNVPVIEHKNMPFNACALIRDVIA